MDGDTSGLYCAIMGAAQRQCIYNATSDAVVTGEVWLRQAGDTEMWVHRDQGRYPYLPPTSTPAAIESLLLGPGSDTWWR